MTEWRDIKSVPTNGEPVLLQDDSFVGLGFYAGDDGWMFWTGEYDAESVEDSYTIILNSWVKGYGPTHWMPLPKATGGYRR